MRANRKLHDRINFRGLQISVENKRGTTRRGVDPGGKPWATKMLLDYGYIRKSQGVDGDHVDVFLGSDETASNVYVITIKAPPDFKDDDEQKCMLGFNSAGAAKAALLKQYDNPKFFGSMITLPFDQFKQKVLATHGNPELIHSEGEALGIANIDPINLKFHPPSLKNPEYIPSDSPVETDNKYLDVTRRNNRVAELEKKGGRRGSGPDNPVLAPGGTYIGPPPVDGVGV